MENVQKITLIESTIDEVEQIVLSKDQIIANLNANIEEFRSNGQKDGNKIHELEIDLDQRTREVIEKDRKLRDLKQTITGLEQSIDDKQEDIDELHNRTRLHLEYAAEKQKEIAQLEGAVMTLKNTTQSKDEQIISIGQELKNQIDLFNKKLAEIKLLTNNITKSQEIIANREQKVFTLEAAVSSLKDIVQDNNRRISDLNKEVEQTDLEVEEKDKFIQAQREKLTQSSKSIKDLQVLLGDAGKTIDNKNKEIEELTAKVDAFKFDKKNLLGIVQQLATIGNPGINIKSLVSGGGVLPQGKQGKPSSRLEAQASQRSFQVLKGNNKSKQGKRNQRTRPQRSFDQSQSQSNRIVNDDAPVIVQEPSNDSANDNSDYATEAKASVAGNQQTRDKEPVPILTTVTSHIPDFPSFIDTAQKPTTALPSLITSTDFSTTTSTTTKPTSSSAFTTSSTTSTTAKEPASYPTEVFTISEALTSQKPTEALNVSPINDNIDTISAPGPQQQQQQQQPAERSDSRRTLRGKLVTNSRTSGMSSKVVGERRKLFGQRTLYY